MKAVIISLTNEEASALERHLPREGGWHGPPPKALTRAEKKILAALDKEPT